MRKILLLCLLALAFNACSSSVPSGEAFNLPNINGAKFDSNADAGRKPIFIAFMATYCGYCKMSVPQVIELQKTFAPKGLKVVGIFGDNAKDAPAQYAKDFNINYDVLYDGGSLAQKIGVNGVPHFVLLDRNHNIVKSWVGYNPNHNFAEEINKVL